ncbi:MAG: hypothetical protein ISP90_15040 [Nevskia sp.]|nr:hypothetical protein [Nevskia sp.]
MSKHHSTRRTFAATVLILGSALTLSAYADGAARSNAFTAVMAVKDPSHYGPHLPAADEPSRYVSPTPGSPAAIWASKDPSRFGPHLAAAETKPAAGSASFAAFESVQASQPAPRPGSWQAIVLAKDPMYFKRGTASATPHN